MLKPHLSYIAAISVHRRTSGYPWRGGSVRSDFQCRLLYLKTYGGSREVAEDDRSLLNSWRWSLGRSKWGVKCSDPNSRISVFWITLMYSFSLAYNKLLPNYECSRVWYNNAYYITEMIMNKECAGGWVLNYCTKTVWWAGTLDLVSAYKPTNTT